MPFTEEQRSVWTDAYRFCQKWNGMKCEEENIVAMSREYCEIVEKHGKSELSFLLMSAVVDWLNEDLKRQAMAKLEAEMEAEGVNEPESEQMVLDF